jgi:SAM-dependent methyltransferase
MTPENQRLLYLFEDSSTLLRISITQGLNISNAIVAEQAWLNRAMNQLSVNDADIHFSKSGYGNVVDFFHEASRDYDSDLKNPYWSFTHEILKFILTTFISEHFRDGRTIKMFDAGAGTGNWSKFILGLSPSIRGIMFDMNAYMLRLAKPKLDQVNTNTKIVEGNLEDSRDFPSEKSNLVLCMHNVIGLARNTELVLRNLYEYLEENGLAFVMTTNKFHAFNFARRFRSQREVLRVVQDGTIKFKDDMPEMFCYTPVEFEHLLRKAGFDNVTVLGFPVTVYPSAQDTKLLRKDTSDNQLRHPQTRAKLLALEKRLCLSPELAYRGGSSLIAVCKKSDLGGQKK